MATYGLRGSQYDSARPWQRKCEIWGRHHGDDIRVVWVRAIHHCDDRVVDNDIEYQFAGSVDG